MISELRFYYGTMASGKTAILLNQNFIWRTKKKRNVFLLKSALDTRSGITTISSRNGDTFEADAIINREMKILPLLRELGFGNGKNPDIVLIDECQFLSSSQIEELREIVSIHNIPVYCYGLLTDANTKSFEGSQRLFEIADKRLELEAYCECCDEKAVVSARVDEQGNVIKPNSQVDIGGDEKYKPMCFKCWLLRGGKL